MVEFHLANLKSKRTDANQYDLVSEKNRFGIVYACNTIDKREFCTRTTYHIIFSVTSPRLIENYVRALPLCTHQLIVVN